MHVIDAVFAVIRLIGCVLAVRELRESRREYQFSKRPGRNGSGQLLAADRLVGSLLSALVQWMLLASVVAVIAYRPIHGRDTHLSLSLGTVISVALASKALLTRAARRKIVQEQLTP